jgi:dienelactone hydrolase
MLFGALVVCWWTGSTSVCEHCIAQRVSLTAGDGAAVSARLYIPRRAPGAVTRDGGVVADELHRPAVVVIPGYLANAGFMEVPWAADLAHAGIVALVLDRRGHGSSGGSWWPVRHDTETRLSDLAPDIHAAVAYLRDRAPLVDPARIALLGHSDGATGAITAASADWDLAATVSISASVAPWEYVNHAAPRNLLLLYGDADRFILADTDRFLIDAATRGYLHDEGETGSLVDGSARRLARVHGYGHLDVLYSDAARVAALDWLARALGMEPVVQLSPLRWPWVVAGLVLLLLLVFVWNARIANFPREGPLISCGKVAVLAALWTGGLAIAGWVGPRLREVPAQEGNIVAALLVSIALSMSAVTIPLIVHRRRHGVDGPRHWARDGARGAVAGLAVQLAAEAILRPVYAFPVTGQRLALFGLFLAVAIPAFAVVCAATAWLPRGQIAPAVPVEIVLAGITAAAATQWFVRMSALPVVLLACTLLFVGAYRSGGRGAIAAAAFGAVMYARAAADVCAFY